MGFFDALERFDKKYHMSDPCLAIVIEKKVEIPTEQLINQNQVRALLEENRRLKEQLRNKGINIIDTDYVEIE